MPFSDDINGRSLRLHCAAPAGKLSIAATKPLRTADDLALAYSPGVAAPVLEIAKNPDDAYRYTGKGNLVAVVSNGTAILGLGNRGALASKPVMEGKAVLFKRFAGIDAFDIEINSTNIDEVVRTVELLEPTFGGINLEDIKAPECFMIERRLEATLGIPVFHDDQHGTAVVVSAGVLNALAIVKKELGQVSIVINGAGAAGIAISRMLGELGIEKDQLLLCDSKGVLSDHRLDLGEFKLPFARKTPHRTLADALKGADIFIGVSKANCLTADMLRSMAKDPIVFALANPDPEIAPDLAKETCPDVIIATGRSDWPNQVNNLLCFPFLFRGVLDARATKITMPMKLAAVRAISALAREEASAEIERMTGRRLSFGRTYILPHPFDGRLLTRVSPAVAAAAEASGVARVSLNQADYVKSLELRLPSLTA